MRCPYSTSGRIPSEPKTPIQLTATRIAKNAAQNAGTILFGSNAHNSQIERRANICRSCEFAQNETCGLCGCGFKRKQQRRSSWCPVLKWDGDIERFAEQTQNSTIAVGITTCPRKEPTLHESWESITDAGFRVITIEDKNRDGAWNTFRRGLAQLVASHPNASAYLMFQDDVKVAKNLAEYLPSILWPDDKTGIVSLYCSGLYKFSENGLHQRNGTTWGALALCFTPLSARLFIKTTAMGNKGDAVVDKRTSRWCKENGLSYWIHSPSLVQHTGKTSTISRLGMMRSRRAKEFCEDASEFIQ